MEGMNSKSAKLIIGIVAFLIQSLSVHSSDLVTNGGIGRRVLLSFKETPEGTNVTFDCSPSGPCVPCQYSEKSDEKYRCSETGYRIPFKCVEIKDGSKAENGKKSQNSQSATETSSNFKQGNGFTNGRSLLDDKLTVERQAQAYITYRSCIPAVNEEKLSVLGFEGIVFCLLIASGSFMYLRRKRNVTMPGVNAGRIQMNSRF